MKEQRIPFPDYPPEEQEKDLKRSLKDIYVMRAGGVWCGFMPDGDRVISIKGQKDDDLVTFYGYIHELFPSHRVRNVNNQGIKEYLDNNIYYLKSLKLCKQL